MELGALVCTPRQPHCAKCPVAVHCVAFKEDRTGELPASAPRAATVRRHFLAFVVGQGSRWLVRQRPGGTVNAHLWEFPNIEVRNRRVDPQRAARLALGAAPARLVELCSLRHTIMHYRITLEAFRAEFDHPTTTVSGQWFTLLQLRKLGFTAAHKKVLNQL